MRSVGFNAGMGNALWDRLSVEVQAEVDGLVSAGRSVQAVAVMRERAGLPAPGLHECVDLVDQRFRVLRQRSPSS
jgi:hypothetical protein